MYRSMVSVLGIMAATGSFAAHHEEPEPMVAEVYECSLSNGVTADDVAALGASEFADFVAEHDISMTSFLWKPSQSARNTVTPMCAGSITSQPGPIISPAMLRGASMAERLPRKLTSWCRVAGLI